MWKKVGELEGDGGRRWGEEEERKRGNFESFCLLLFYSVFFVNCRYINALLISFFLSCLEVVFIIFLFFCIEER